VLDHRGPGRRDAANASIHRDLRQRGSVICITTHESRSGDAQRVLACLGDPSRFRMVALLAGGDRCVTDIAREVRLSQSCTTRHLQVLLRHAIVSRVRKASGCCSGCATTSPTWPRSWSGRSCARATTWCSTGSLGPPRRSSRARPRRTGPRDRPSGASAVYSGARRRFPPDPSSVAAPAIESEVEPGPQSRLVGLGPRRPIGSCSDLEDYCCDPAQRTYACCCNDIGSNSIRLLWARSCPSRRGRFQLGRSPGRRAVPVGGGLGGRD